MRDPIATVIKEVEYQIGRNRLALEGGCDGAQTLRDRITTLTGILDIAKGVAEEAVHYGAKEHLEMVPANLAAEIIQHISDGWGEDEGKTAVGEIAPLIRRTLSSFVTSGSGAPASGPPDPLGLDTLADRIIRQLSDGWGEAEDARAADEIKPILREALGVVAPQTTI
ncbi:hypothetical protein [Microvirga massiliensis]|uniref:hypothetical protein n=1 Tax=Microvirga massiliensis TaxID=1033741 RepID=UPI00062BC2C9|nr:hypothetical protein [Microvirga massiliensis]